MAVARVSTEEQEEKGFSLPAQREKFEGFAAANGLELVRVFSDSESAKDTNREGLQAALAMLERGEAEVLLVAKLDRLTRNIADFEMLLARYFRERFTLLSVGDVVELRSASGRMVARLLIVVAQWEREANGERTSVGMRQAKKSGGGAPTVDGAALARILELAGDGLSPGAIAIRLEAEHVPTVKGGRWAKQTVRKVIDRARAA